MSTIIEVKDLKKYFNSPKGVVHAVDGVNLKIERGTTFGLVGESGCGKSTLGRVMVHLLEATAGQILYDGQDITKLKRKNLHTYRNHIQMIFQDPYSSLDPRKSVYQTIAEPLRVNKKGTRAEIDAKVKELMDTVGLAERVKNSYPHELDGGRRQRIGIARALTLEPEFIVCDEPVSALDVSIQAQVLNLLMDLQEQKKLTYLFITHDMSVVKHISDNIGVMYLGMMVESAATDVLFDRPLHPYTTALLSAIPTTDIDNPKEQILLRGEITSPIDPKPGCRFAPRCPYATEECFSQMPPLHEIEQDHFVACYHPLV